jgi:hypothetical protein
MIHASGLGAGQYMVYVRLVIGNIVALEWFYYGMDNSFVASPIGRDVESYFH